MNIPQTGPKGWKLILPASLAALALCAGICSTSAQGQAAPLINPTGTPRTAPAGGTGSTGAVSAETAAEDRLMGSLASREMDSLLNYYFEKHHITPERQDVVKSIVAWREMGNPNL